MSDPNETQTPPPATPPTSTPPVQTLAIRVDGPERTTEAQASAPSTGWTPTPEGPDGWEPPTSAPENWTGGLAAWQELSRARWQAKQLKAQVAAIPEKYIPADQHAAEVAKVRAQAERTVALAVMAAKGAPQLNHPDVAEHISSAYDRYRSRAGEEAAPFAQWLQSDDARNHPLVAPYLPKAVEPDPVEAINAQPAAPALVTMLDAQGNPVQVQAPFSTGASFFTGTAQPTGPTAGLKFTPENVARWKAQGAYRVGRINADGTLSGGTQLWQQHMAALARR